MEQIYENHSLVTREFPVIFHNNQLQKNRGFFHPHWHENIELLFMTDGITEVMLDNSSVQAKPGDIIVVNSSVTHNFRPITEFSSYECLIIDKNFCEQFGFFVDEKFICHHISDERLFSRIRNIRKLKDTEPKYFSAEILSDVLKILSILFREYIDNNYFEKVNKNLEMVKSGIKYIRKHIKENMTIDEIAAYAGYSKYHFCRCFKDITGHTVNSYINQAKIDQAYKQLSQGESNVGDIAAEYGFNDISYFTKVFKKYTHTLPSKVGQTER